MHLHEHYEFLCFVKCLNFVDMRKLFFQQWFINISERYPSWNIYAVYRFQGDYPAHSGIQHTFEFPHGEMELCNSFCQINVSNIHIKWHPQIEPGLFLYRIRFSWFEVKITVPTHHKFFVRGQRERYPPMVGLELVRCINCRKVSPSCCSLAKTHCSSLPEYLIFAAGLLSFCTVSRGVNPQL